MGPFSSPTNKTTLCAFLNLIKTKSRQKKTNKEFRIKPGAGGAGGPVARGAAAASATALSF